MKDFLSQFMNQPETKIASVVEKKPVEKKETKPKTVKSTESKLEIEPIPQPKALDVVNEGISHSESPKSKTQKTKFTEGVGEVLSAEAFLLSINDKSFSFNKKKNLQIDDQLFNVLNLLKQHEGIKSIATLLNAIIEKYIDDNKVELKKILSKNPLT